MYRINPLMRGVLITTDEVIFHAPTKQTLDPRTIQNAIIIAEERFIVPALGYAMYYDMAATKNVTVTSANKAALQLFFPVNPNPQVKPVVLTEGMIVNAFEQMPATYQTLWIQQLWKLIAECVMVVAMPEGFVQFGTEGVIHSAPPAGPMTTTGAVTPDLKSVRWALDKKVQDRVDPLIAAMQNWICYQRSLNPASALYPLYTTPCPCDGETTTTRKTNVVLGMYDDEDSLYNPCGCNE